MKKRKEIKKMILYLFLVISFLNSVISYKPVVIVHGIMSEAKKLDDLKKMILNAHPGTNVTLLKSYPEIESFVPLQIQLKTWEETIKPIMEAADDGIHLVCHSQGGLICQGIVVDYDDHNINTFISLSTPLMGQFGIPFADYLPEWLSEERTKVSRLMYTDYVQEKIAISNYWRDPRKEYRESYLDHSRYLPILQNDPQCPRVLQQEAERRKTNFLKLKKLVLIGGSDDGVIIPWQSSNFGFYDENYDIVDYKNQTVFKEDWFGLRTLFERGDVVIDSVPGVTHRNWHGNKKVFEKFIAPFLN